MSHEVEVLTRTGPKLIVMVTGVPNGFTNVRDSHEVRETV